MTQKRKDVTYFNVTPAQPTWPILEAQGFKPYCSGLHFSMPALSRARTRHDGRSRHSGHVVDQGLPDADLEMLKRQCGIWQSQPCMPHGEGALPFVFLPLRKRRGIIPMPAMQLGYCRSIPIISAARERSDAICSSAESRLSSSMPTGPSQDYPASTARRTAANISRALISRSLGDLTETELAIYGM